MPPAECSRSDRAHVQAWSKTSVSIPQSSESNRKDLTRGLRKQGRGGERLTREGDIFMYVAGCSIRRHALGQSIPANTAVSCTCKYIIFAYSDCTRWWQLGEEQRWVEGWRGEIFFFNFSWRSRFVSLRTGEKVHWHQTIKQFLHDTCWEPRFCVVFFSLNDIVSQSIGTFSVKGQILAVMQTRVMTLVSDAVLQKIWPPSWNSDACIVRQKGLPRLLNTCPSHPLDNIVSSYDSTVMILSFRSLTC